MNRTFEIITTDGLMLRGMCWPAEGTCKAAISLIHGMGEHIGRYDHVATAFNARGYTMMGTDLRGHGKSDGKRGHVPTFGTYLDDLFQSLEKMRADFPGIPHYIFAHSLGGMIALDYVLRRKPDLAGLIVSAPLLQLAYKPSLWRMILLKSLKALNLNIPIPRGVDDTKLSRDINVARTFRNDPLSHGVITPTLAVGMFEAGDWCLAHADQLELPTLIYHGDADLITSLDASRRFVEKAGSNCTFNLLPGCMHEPHNEPQRQEVFDLILNWLSSRLTGEQDESECIEPDGIGRDPA